MLDLDKRFSRFTSFSLAGLANTLVGVTAITIAGLAGAGPVLANAIGYGLGLLTSFALNSRFTFRARQTRHRTLPRFIVAFMIAFAANLIIVLATVRVIGMPELIGNLAGLPVYIGLFFLLCEHWVFKEQRDIV